MKQIVPASAHTANLDPLSTGVPLIQRVDCKPAQQLGVEIGRLLRHDVSGERDLLKLLERNRLNQKGDIRLARGDLIDGFRGFAQKSYISELCNPLLRKPKDAVEQNGMQLHNIQLRLPVRYVLKAFAMASGFG